MGRALEKALRHEPSALFCDSWEIDTRGLWSPELWEAFDKEYGYDLREYSAALDEHPEVRYDYQKFIATDCYRGVLPAVHGNLP